jgi:hypothetical protein
LTRCWPLRRLSSAPSVQAAGYDERLDAGLSGLPFMASGVTPALSLHRAPDAGRTLREETLPWRQEAIIHCRLKAPITRSAGNGQNTPKRQSERPFTAACVARQRDVLVPSRRGRLHSCHCFITAAWLVVERPPTSTLRLNPLAG